MSEFNLSHRKLETIDQKFFIKPTVSLAVNKIYKSTPLASALLPLSHNSQHPGAAIIVPFPASRKL